MDHLEQKSLIDKLLSSLVLWLVVAILATAGGMVMGTFKTLMGSWQAWLFVSVPLFFARDFGSKRALLIALLMLYSCLLMVFSVITAVLGIF